VAEVDEIFVIRATLFGLAARLFAGRADQDDLQTLDKLFKQMKALGPDQAMTHAEISAQMAIVLLDQCGNSRLKAMLLQLARQVARYTRLGLQTAARRKASIASWRSMLRAFSKGDAPDADHIGQQMVSNTHQEVIKQLGTAPGAEDGANND
jgi:DNA-binding GntR family transcriptional regulator